MSTPNVCITNNPVIVTKGDPIRVEVRPNGGKGDAGQGVPEGGATGQVLTKASATDYDTAWVDNPAPPVDSVNGQTGDVVLGATDVGAYPDTNPSNFIDASGAPVQSVTGTAVKGTSSDPVIDLPTPADIGAYPDSNPSGYVDATGAAAAAPIQSVTGDGVGGTAADVVMTFPTAGEIGAEPAWAVTTDNTGTLTGTNVLWLADTSAARNRTLDTDGQRLQVKDVTGSAGTNNITLTAGSGQTINGNATETIDVNYGWVEYVRSGTNWVTIGGQA